MKIYKRGYTTGVFDMFHIGHLNLLKNAKQHCEELVVGVSTDELVGEYKNKTPVIPFEERFAIIEAIRWVDRAVVQNNMDKLENILKYQCDVVLVGDDWKGSERWNRFEKEFSAYGVSVIYLPYTQGTSSTQLRGVINKILQY